MLFAGLQPKQIANSLSSRIYITACFRAVARRSSVWDNTLYLAAFLLPLHNLQSVSTWDGGGSGSEYQPQGKLLQPTCAAAWLLALLPLPLCCSPLCLHSEINTNGQGGYCFCRLKRTTLAPCEKSFGQQPEAGCWDPPTTQFGCSFCPWPCLPLGGFPALPQAMLLSASKTCSLLVCSPCF